MGDMGTFALDTVKFVVLLLLGGVCTVGSMACLLSIGLAAAQLSNQAATWLKTSRWDPSPLADLFGKFGYAPHVDWLGMQTTIERLMSLESGPVVIVLAAAFWGCILMMFDRALKRWGPAAGNA